MIRKAFFLCAAVVPAIIVGLGLLVSPLAFWSFALVGPLLLVGLRDVTQRRHSLLRVYPIIGHGRYLMEALRPEIQQYFVETNINGSPYNREQRSLIYQRCKGALDTLPFGTQREVYRVGYEWIGHSLAPKDPPKDVPRVLVGPECKKPYASSYLNISAMSFGSLSRNAVLALNLGAKQGNFAHNTGEGSISPYHLEHGGDLIWQIGTGYFGCRDKAGNFDPERFRERAAQPTVRMIEVKLSQGAKPGHGGILPAAKLSPEIAEIRGVDLGKDVISPPAHRAFSGPKGLLHFVAHLRELADGKPVGFKLCVGHRSEFLSICKAMVATQCYPDFITIDGTEGGTGAAPLELSNSVGMPLRHGLSFVHNALRGFGVRRKMRLAAAGKVVTGFDIFRLKALGADMCNSARAMMFALGCIQARRCNDNSCPVGVATQDPWREIGLSVPHKSERVARYQAATIHSFIELVGAAGLESPDDIRPFHLRRQVDLATIRRFDELYPELGENILLHRDTVPADLKYAWDAADPECFRRHPETQS